MSFLLNPMRRGTSTTLPTFARRTFSSTPSSQLARITLVGRLGSEPEALVANNGTHIIKYNVATNYGPKDNRQTSWFRVSSFTQEGPHRDMIMGLSKGTLVYLEGDAQMRSFSDDDGKKHASLSVVQTRIEVLKRPTTTEPDGSIA